MGIVLILLSSASPIALAGAKPPDDPVPTELRDKDWGIDEKTGEYCDKTDPDPKKRNSCRPAKPCEVKRKVCTGSAVDVNAELANLEKQRRTNPAIRDNDKVYEKAKKCIKDEKLTAAACILKSSLFPKFKRISIFEFAAKEISEAAADAFQEAARKLGESVVWLLQEFATAFNDISTISLNKTGLSLILGVTTGVSVIIAAFLLLVQFAKLAVSQSGGPLVTALTGLAKWGVILGVYLLATQVALNWADTFSTALINESFSGGGHGEKDAQKVLQQRLGEMFSGLIGGAGTGSLVTGGGMAVGAIGFVIVISILCIIAIGALWVEMLIRQAAIMILVAVMPIVLAGQMADSTREWWPKARNALITLILMKPVIVICFSVGFGAMSSGEGVQNVLVGLLIFIIAGFSWPALAQFMTFTSSGGGSSAASGLLGSAGSSISSAFGGNRAALGGAGMAGGGTAYTKALEAENDRGAGGSGSMSAAGNSGGVGRGFWSKAMTGKKAGSFGSKVKGSVGTGMQLAALGQNTLESTATNTAANAGLGPGAPGGRHVVVPSSAPGGGAQRSESSKPAAPASPDGSSGPSPSPAAPASGGSSEGGPSPAAAPPPPPDSAPTGAPPVSPPAPAPDSKGS
ncbi:hypothetical protein CD790_21340 [Streptomyces sp. SAJ15]|nr:hypothetical protein CD790_21340 [Streptomyces sp. SAJ15]